ncbi:hypothetical protein [Desulfoluna spongiiphila]|uniref:hypothetical protein n=1 Tax=Desulfoluna spongiiphila TaxID=419481 RepID=UPI0012564A5D|nr:hypothetical protein [Desulfoluna spongiiphila]VVS91457.1 hypothetical protein DBB_10250 [Desulfoluna spongiiphila]
MIERILENRLCVLALALMGYSSAILLLAVLLGVGTGDVYKGYLETPNWFLFPLFWIPAVYLYGTTWSQLYSSIREFGLERWNQTLNMIYWALSPALVIPIVSKASQGESGAGDTGQKMIQWLVPLLFLSPMLFTIIVRQKKVMKLWAIIRQEEDRDKVEAYRKQLLWPLGRNWASKLGIIIAFSLLIFLVGDMLTEIGVDKLIK